MKFISWNVNGIRAWHKKGASDWLFKQNPDFICLQETKAHPDQLPPELLSPSGYHSFFDHSKVRKGYSGVAVYAKEKPEKVEDGLGTHDLDQEGRFLALHYKNFSIINCYFPNGGGGPERLDFKLKYYDKFFSYISNLQKSQRNIIFCGDVNTAHNEIDIARPKENEKHTGFLRIERDWMDKIVSKGWIDTFRKIYPEKIQYSWWDMKTFARDRNIGWRIDYFFVSRDLEKKIQSAKIHDQVLGSDHCPIELEIE